MGKIWITSDLHFHHNKPFIYKARGFNSIDEHDYILWHNWQSYVHPDDDVYILGDLMLNDKEKGRQTLASLNGHLHIAIGNHDSNSKIEIYKTLPNVVEVEYAYRLKYKKWKFYLTHYPSEVGFIADCPAGVPNKKVWNLCGHWHTDYKYIEMESNKRIYHVEPEAHDYRPVLLEEIIADIESFYEISY